MSMAKYKSNAPPDDRVAYGIELEAGLSFFTETGELAEPLKQQNEGLDQLQREREQSERLVIPHRAKVKFANFAFDGCVRGCSKAAEMADGGKRGAIHAAIFPKGLGPVITPSGAAQIAPGEKWLRDLAASKHPGVAAICEEWHPKATEKLQALKDAVQGRDQAYGVVAQAVAKVHAASDDHELAIERIQGQVKATFPKDRARWDVIFPSARSARGGDVEDPDEPVVEPPK